MTSSSEQIMEWHNDGHSISIMLNKSIFLIDKITCPNDEFGACHSDAVGGCFVQWFLNRYGFDCNVGVVPAQPHLEIAWTRIAESPHDPEQWQVWVIPTSDEIFAAWMATQNGGESSASD